MTEVETPIATRVARDYEMYCSAISDDPVATILRIHLLTEYFLEQTIRICLPRGDRIIDSGNFSFSQKLGVVDALNEYPDKLVSSLKNLNKVRNKCSHQMSHQISHADLETIGSPLGKDWTVIKNSFPDAKERMRHLFGTLSAFLSGELEKAEIKHHC